MSDDKDRIEAAQAWQNHRKECVEIAIRAGGAGDECIILAGKISAFIIKKSELELGITANQKDEAK